ncbi:hypothetical protein [Streptomyces adelaidensis]|uniref:hypothetical protein n=1 Tax=Streptomyces adelaidensis TaxID=2796465 RepID=UPI001F48D070|nr:hypothetical protein [Streptomyces adelaidensis]
MRVSERDEDGHGCLDRGPGRDRSGNGKVTEGGSREVRLPEELRALGRSLDRPGADGDDGAETMVERVLRQILAERVPTPVAEPPGFGAWLRAVRRRARLHWRVLTAALCGLLAALVLTPPVRAAVADWFHFGGVEVRYDPSATPSPGAGVPGCPDPVPLAEAERRAGFAPLVPGALGAPDAVSVTRAPKDRFVVTLCWTERGGTVRLDEYAARLAPEFAKTVAGERQMEWVELSGVPYEALWFPEPHLLRFWMTSEDGSRFTRSERTAGPTLLWVHDDEFTLRLEGVESRTRAREIAESAVSVESMESVGSAKPRS